MDNIVIHLGLHKTATKFLQVDFFPKLKDYFYIPKHTYEREFLDILLHDDTPVFEAKKEALKSTISKLSENSKNVIISNELFSGNPFFRYSTRFTCLKRLHELYPNAKLILSLRGQKGMIDSLYREYILQGGVKGIEDFIAGRLPRNKSILSVDPTMDPETLKYGPYLDEICKLFGRENLHVVAYEKMIQDFEGFIQGLADFLCHDVSGLNVSQERRHSSLDNSYLKLLRQTNQLHRSALHHGGILNHKYNIAHILRKMNLTKLNRSKSSMFDYKMPVDYTEDNKYIDEKYNLSLKSDFAEYYFPEK